MKFLSRRNPNKYLGNELKYLQSVIKADSWSSLSGSWVGRAESAFCDLTKSRYAIAMNSGTSTIHSILESLRLEPGCEVLMPALTVIMDSTVCYLSNLVPVYVDIDPKTFLIDPKDAARKITSKTRVLISVSLYGNVPEMSELRDICDQHKIFLIEDNAQAIVATYNDKQVGAWGDASSWSFENTKHISCGEGGMVTTTNTELAEKVRKVGGHGFKNLRAEEGRVRLTEDIFQDPMYERHDVLGWNYRMSEISAAVALAQIERAHELVNLRRYSAYQMHKACVGSGLLEPQLVPKGVTSDYYTFACTYNEEYSRGISWQEFRRQFKESTGYGIYGAWQLQYNEPVVKNGEYKYRNPGIYSNIPSDHMCPFAENVQPRIMQFKTNIRSKALARRVGEQLYTLICRVKG